MKQYHIINVLQLTFTGLLFISAILFVKSRLDVVFGDSIRVFDWDIATLSLIVTAIGTFFAIFFRWRADVRNERIAAEQTRKTEARFEKLENEVKWLKSRISSE